jgi:predicted Zn-dependent peptidase
VRAFYEKHYTLPNMVVVVVGDVDYGTVEKAARTAFQADQPARTAPAAFPEEERACAQAERRAVTAGFLSGYAGISFPAPSVAQVPDTHAMDVLLTMLEHDGTGRLPRALRGVGGVRATYETRRQAGLFYVVAATGTTPPEDVEALLRRELDFLVSRAVPEEEVRLAKRMLHGSYALDNEPYAGQAGTLGYYAAIDRWQFAAEYLQRVDAVTPEVVLETARAYFDAQRSVSVIFRGRNRPAAGA